MRVAYTFPINLKIVEPKESIYISPEAWALNKQQQHISPHFKPQFTVHKKTREMRFKLF